MSRAEPRSEGSTLARLRSPSRMRDGKPSCSKTNPAQSSCSYGQRLASHQHWGPNGRHPPTMGKATRLCPPNPASKHCGQRGQRALWVSVRGTQTLLTIPMEPSRLPLRSRNKAQLVWRSHPLMWIDTTLHSESSPKPIYIFIKSHRKIRRIIASL